MAFDAGTVEGHLDLEAGEFLKSLKRAREALDKVAKNEKKARSGFKKFKDVVGLVRDAVIILPAAFNAVSGAIKGVIGILRGASDASLDFELTTRKLSTALSLAGEVGASRVTKELQRYADAMQDATGISNTMFLQVAQTLTIMGTSTEQLEDATTAVVEYAEATGADAVQAARLFGKTYSGALGELSEALPALKAVSTEALKTGEAFRFAGRAFGGTAKEIAKTTFGIRRAFMSALSDMQRAVGDALNPVLNAITEGFTKAIKNFTTIVNDNQGAVREAFAKMGKGILAVVRRLLDFALDFPTYKAEIKAFVFDVVAAFKTGAMDLEATLLGTVLRVQESVANMLRSIAELPGFETAAGFAANVVAEAASDTELAIIKSKAAAEGMTKELVRQSNEQHKVAEAARATAAGIRDGSIHATNTAKAYNVTKGILDDVEGKLNDIHDVQDATITSINGATMAVQKQLAARKAWLDSILAGEDAIGRTASAVGAATGATNQLRNSAAGAADEYERMAGAAGAAQRAAATTNISGTGAFGTMDFGRREGRTVGLGLEDPFSAISTLRSLEARAGKVSGQYGGALRRSAGAVVNDVREAVQSTIDRAFADYTEDLVRELNSLGILGAEERRRFIQERLAEAERLGVLPPRGGATFGGLG